MPADLRGGARTARPRRLLGFMLVAAGAVLLLQAATGRARGMIWQAGHDRVGLAPAAARPGPGDAVARLRIPRLGLDTVVVEGTDQDSLKLGPGHLPGSALPGEPDNCIIAGHRDGAFRRLAAIALGDVVEVEGGRGAARYRVASIAVVPRDDARSLAPASRPLLTLVTCYPMRFIGPAPERLVVRGELVSGPPAAPDPTF